MNKIILVIAALLMIVFSSISYAEDVTTTLDVEWTNLFWTYYIVSVCVENTDDLGDFNTMLIEYSKYTPGYPPMPVQSRFTQVSESKWCSNMAESGLWSTNNVLAFARITVKQDTTILYKDIAWGTNVPVNVYDTNHIFSTY